MGSAISSQVGGVMEKQQENMRAAQFKMFERQATMQRVAMERQMAVQVARARDTVKWFGSFYVVVLPALIGRARATGNKAWVGPLLPLTFVLGYQLDFAYGTKMDRIITEAESVLVNEYQMVRIPYGPVKPVHIDNVLDGKSKLHERS